MFRIIAGLVVGGALLASALGSAAQLNVQGGIVQAGTDGSLSCALDPVKVVAWAVNTIDGPYEGLDWATIEISSADSVRCDGDDLVGRLQLTGGGVSYGGAYWSGFGPIPINPSWIRISSGTTTYKMGFYPNQSYTTKDWVDPELIQSITLWLGGPDHP